VRIFVFKPDGIGDFVLATGTLRLLAREFGEENLVICVKTILVPLAREQFPAATVLDLPTAATRKVLNLFVWNFLATLPLWGKLRGARVDAALCLRSMRNYLETWLFYSARARRFIACENTLLSEQKKVRTVVEQTAAKWFRAELLPYTQARVPWEVEANRAVAAQLLGREVSTEEVQPSLRASPPHGDSYWIFAPITNVASKVYPFAKWQEVFAHMKPLTEGKKILLAGVPDERPRLEEMLQLLREAGIGGAEIHLPPDLNAYVNLIGGAELMLTVDTAAAHFAIALDRPTAIVFSGLHSGMFGPWQRSERQCWLMAGEAASGKKKKWHAGIAPARVAETARRLLTSQENALPQEPPSGHAAHASCSQEGCQSPK